VRISDARLLVLDTETTGIDPATARVVELGGVLLEAGRPIKRMRSLIYPGGPIPPECTKVHGISDADVAGAPPFEDLADRLVDLLEGVDATAGYNGMGYDSRVLAEELWRAMVYPPPPQLVERMLDPLVFVRQHLRHLRKRDLGAIAAHFGVRLDEAHTAVADALAAAEVIREMVAAGHIPDDLDEALRLQVEFATLQGVEGGEWSFWLYADRARPGLLRIGCGKHCGAELDSVPPGYAKAILDKVADLPDRVRAEFERIAAKGGGRRRR